MILGHILAPELYTTVFFFSGWMELYIAFISSSISVLFLIGVWRSM